MRKLALLLSLAALFSCTTRDFKYKIVGKQIVEHRKHDHDGQFTGSEEIVDVIAYTDTIHGWTEDSVWYYNSNGSRVTILRPFKVYEADEKNKK